MLVNYLKIFEKVYDLGDSHMKFIRVLPNNWDSKTIAIREARLLSEMSLLELYGNLLTYQLEIDQKWS